MLNYLKASAYQAHIAARAIGNAVPVEFARAIIRSLI